jgi:pilus assembly protein CpaC
VFGLLALFALTAVAISPASAQPPEKKPQVPPAPEGATKVPTERPTVPVRPDIFGPGQRRLPALGVQAPLGTTPKPSPQVLQDYSQFVERFIDPDNTLDLVLNRPRLLILKETPKRIQVGSEDVATYNEITPKEITILGKQVGTTILNFWFADPKDPNKERILSYLVRVIPDPEAKERLERVYKALEEEINRNFPDSWVCLALVGDKLVVSGQAKDIAEGTQILRIIRANAPGEADRIPVDRIDVTITPDALGPDGLPAQGLQNFLVAGGPNVINLLRIPGEQQVCLRVTVAEINRAAARSIGLNFSLTNNNGVTYFANRTGNITSSTGAFGAGGTAGQGGAGIGQGIGQGLGGNQFNQTGGIANLPTLLDNGQVSLLINALRSMSYARTLAEPNLVTLNGKPATFQAGGQFPVPIVTGFTASGLQGVSFVPFGVQLSFTPYITDRDRIRLEIQAEVSARDNSTPTTNIGGAQISGLTSRTFQTTVELREGQTLAVAGLIQNNLGANSDRVPLLGDLPVVGRLWGFDRISAGEQELVVLITPELVHPMEPKEVPPLPGSDVFEPGDLEFYLLGRLESLRSYDYRSPVMTDLDRMKRYRRCEQLYIIGPHGHSPAQPQP